MYRIKKAIAVTLTLGCVVGSSSIDTLAAKAQTGRFEIDTKVTAPADGDTNNKARGASLPTSYRSPYLTSIKNQGTTNLCWAFAAAAAGESSYIKKGYAGTSLDFSERHLGYFSYAAGTDPLGNSSKDKATITGSNWRRLGGNAYMTTTILSAWKGYAAESVAPFSSSAGVTASKAHSNTAIMTDSDWLGETINKTTVKNAIVNNGAVLAAYYATNSSAPAYYSGTNGTPNHEIVLVGWDDNYSRNNFSIKPTNNGAWLVKNSWGTSVGDSGYYWISYDEKSLCEPMTVVADKTSKYQYNYHYDGTGAPMAMSMAKGDKASVVFTAKKGSGSTGEYLKAVNILAWDAGTSFNVQVYRNPSTGKPESGSKQLSSAMKCTATYAGVHTFDLPKKIELLKGQKYSIVITANKAVRMGVDSTETLNASWGIKIKYSNTTAKNQSQLYKKSTKKWLDLHSEKASARIKGYTVTGSVKPHLYYATASGTKYTYTGKSITPNVKLKYNGKTLVKGTDYTVKIKKKTTTGSAVVTFTGKGAYRGTRNVTYYVVPKAPSLKSAKSKSKKSITVSYKKATGASGYQVVYKVVGAKKNSSKYTTAKTKKITGLTSKKTYEVKVRAYKTVNGKKQYGSYSKTKKVKVK